MTFVYPRPQMVRDEFTMLDGPWRFIHDPDDIGVTERWFDPHAEFTNTIIVPNPPESPASGISQDVTGPIWYRRDFDHRPQDGGRLLLHFEGVDHLASVWVNSTHVGDHEGSQSRFTVDITDAVRPGTNTLVVRAIDSVTDLEQPRGKQDWLPAPHVIWYRRTSGIWRSVWLEPVPPVRIDRLNLQSGPTLGSVDVEARIYGLPDAQAILEVELRLAERLLCRAQFECVSGTVAASLRLDHESIETQPEDLWWSPESPTLLDVVARLRVGTTTVDRVRSYVGLRTVGIDGSNVLLNNRPYFLRLVLEQGYWPESHLASPSIDALETEARLIKELGFNGIRMHQTSADPRFLACCDRLGLVVLADTAAAYRFSDIALRRQTDELMAMIGRDASHPCVIAWVLFNESWGVPDLQTRPEQRQAVMALTALAKALDPTRIVLGNDGWEYVAGDVIGVHDYTQDPRQLDARYGTADAARHTVRTRRPGTRPLMLPGNDDAAECLPILLSEFGGISAHNTDDAWEAYGDVIATEELASRVGQLVAAVSEGSGLAGFCYTQLTDTAQEKNGLLTETRQPKCPLDTLRDAIRANRPDQV